MSGFASIGPDPASQDLKRMVTEIVLWNERDSPRSRQRAIGPSEVGNSCDRRIAYRLVGTKATNIWGDPWPAIVGTAIHHWMETAIKNFQRQKGDHGWMTELAVQPDDLVRGHSDAYHIPTQTVVDWKTTNADTIRKLKRGEPPAPGYITQIHLYGLGHERAGRPVKEVALVYLQRSGWLEDAFVWHQPYDQKVARAALDRMYRIGFQLMDLDIEKHSENFAQIQADPGDSCVWCPMFNRDLDPDATASDRGCPGR